MRAASSLLAAAGLALTLAGCVTGQPTAFDGTGPAFAPERYFAGRTHLWGVVESTQGGPATQFSGSMAGRREADGSIGIDESLTYVDGSKLNRTWRLRRLAGQQIEATGSDIAGTGTGEVSGRMLHLRYSTAPDQPGRAGGTDVEHWMYLQDDGVTVLNRTVTRRAGVVVRMATERLVRADDARPASARKVARLTTTPRRDAAGDAATPSAARAAPGISGVLAGPAASDVTGSTRSGVETPSAGSAADGKAGREGSWLTFDLRR